MTGIDAVLILVAVGFALATLFGRGDPPSAGSAGQWINDHAYNEALREARLRRLQRW